MIEDLRQRLDALDASMCRAPLAYRKLAVDALELLEQEKTRAAVAGYDASFDAVRWEQKPLDCEGVEVGGKGKADIRRCFTRKG